jgi:choline dehydrogenase
VDADYVVVGTGSAGAVVANRLSASGTAEVVVLEAGPRDKDKFIHIPAGVAKLFHSEVDWDYLTEPQKELNGRQIYWPRGKMLGGSSSMNRMMWVRGFAADYDEWGELVSEQWSFAQLAPYFDRIEAGPLEISPQRSPRRSTAAWLAAVQESGHRIELPNTDAPDGFCQTMVTQRRGARWSCADAYLKPALRRANLTLFTEALARRVLFDGQRAVGVEFDKDDYRHVVRARREVVLCGGAVNSPQLLLLSGIGDRTQLAEHGIDVVHHAPEVGENLTEHLLASLGFNVTNDSLFGADKPLQRVNYLLRRRGMLTSPGPEAYGFARSRPELKLPDLELLFAPAPLFDNPSGHAVTLVAILLKPLSRGSVSLRSPNPKDNPIIDPGYLTDEDGVDRATLMTGLRMCASIARSPALKDVLGTLAWPRGARDLSDSTLEDSLNNCSRTIYHPVGTCRMGSDDASVVDPQLRVRGVDGLRVADASVMPSIIRGHTHAPSVLIGEKAAELIRA